MSQVPQPTSYARVHCIGLGGIGVSAVAKWLRLRGTRVTGSDVAESELLQSLKSQGIKYWLGSHPEKMGRDLDLVIFSSAVPEDDEERVRARHLGVREVSYNDFLGEMTDGHELVAVTGTHGKSTTTAMLGAMLVEAERRPTVVVGSQMEGFSHGNLQMGDDKLFIVEACEHQAHMLVLLPRVIVLTNIEFDHPDYYRDVEHVRETMKLFVERLPADGVLVWNAGDEQSRAMVESLARPPKLLSVGDGGDVWARTEASTGRQVVHVHHGDDHIGDVELRVPGEYNATNALMAVAAASVLHVPWETMRRSLESFEGLWRRFERLGVWRGAEVYSDYAHHPTAVARLLEGVRTFLPGRHVVLCYQPHQHARTRGLFDEFVVALGGADIVVIAEIYGVAGRREGEKAISSHDLVEAMRCGDRVFYAHNEVETRARLEEVVREGDVLLMVGAGDIDTWARRLLSSGNS